MPSYENSIDINAPARIVAGLLLDLSSWTSWTRTAIEVTPLGKAQVQPGTRVRVRQPRLPVSVWTVDVADGSTFEWNNLRHGLRTVARHRLTDTGRGCRLDVRIDQDGILVRPVSLFYGGVIRRHLTQMCQDLKHAAESAAGTESLDLDRAHRHSEPEQELRRSFSENR